MKRAFNHLLFSDPVLKIFSVVLGCALFLLVREDRIRELEVSVPVIIGEVGEARILTSPVPSSLRVRVRGRWSSMIRVLEGRAAPYEVKMTTMQDGDLFSFEANHLKGLIGVPGLSIVGIEPQSFELRIEEKLSRIVPIEVLTVGNVPDDYVVDPGAISYEPKSVRVSGPRSTVENIDKISSYPIALDGLQRDLRADIWLKRPPEQFVSLGFDQITVEIAVYEREGESVLKDVPVYVENCAEDRICTPSPSSVDLVLRGSLSRIRAMEKQEAPRWLMVNAAEFDNKAGQYRNALVLARPIEGVVLLPKPRKVRLRIQEVSQGQPENDVNAEKEVRAEGEAEAPVPVERNPQEIEKEE